MQKLKIWHCGFISVNKTIVHMNILSHFAAEQKKYLILKLKKAERDVFLVKLPKEYRHCYITDAQLSEIVKKHKNKITAKEIIQSKIPDPGNVMAGDFSEITIYFLLHEKYLPRKMNGPKKWRWKVDGQKTMPYTDIVLFNRGDKASKDDLLVAAETKTKATATKKNPIEEAIDGASHDNTSRLAKTLAWLKRVYTSIEPDPEMIKYLERFIDSQKDEYGKYTKHFKAVVVMDRAFLDDELSKVVKLPDIKDEFEVIVVAIDDLKQAYELTYQQIVNT